MMTVCTICPHFCDIEDGGVGKCRVRTVRDGHNVPVGLGFSAAAYDPIEKKNLYHWKPGSSVVGVGSFGCNYHCNYCFDGETPVLMESGVEDLAGLYARTEVKTPDGAIAYPSGERVVDRDGVYRKVEAVFRHPYTGRMAVVKPYGMPAIKATEDHAFYATTSPYGPVEKVLAKDLTKAHYLLIPKPERVSGDRVPSIMSFLSTAWEGQREDATPYVEDGHLHFSNSQSSGVSERVAMTVELARLLGFYCAKGCVVPCANRPNSYTVSFSFGKHEPDLVEEVLYLKDRCFGVEERVVERTTTTAVCISNNVMGLVLKELAGSGSSAKRVPGFLFTAEPAVQEAFLDAYMQGDGHLYPNGKISITTASKALAYGLAALLVCTGRLPSVYNSPRAVKGRIQRRTMRQAPSQYTVVWYDDEQPSRIYRETPTHFLVPVRSVTFEAFDGFVYNMQVAESHTYTAGMVAVSNCQNWRISQSVFKMVDSPIKRGDDLVRLIEAREECRGLFFGYSEPLVLPELIKQYAPSVKERGYDVLVGTNGYTTRETLHSVMPLVDAFVVSLRGYTDGVVRDVTGANGPFMTETALHTVDIVKAAGKHVEVTYCVIPGVTDSHECEAFLTDMALFHPTVPVHLLAYVPHYKGEDKWRMPTDDEMRNLWLFGKNAGLRYVYAENCDVPAAKVTSCPKCDTNVFVRGEINLIDRKDKEGKCPCGENLHIVL
jgi:pyruvate formate lyase activating enzyme